MTCAARLSVCLGLLAGAPCSGCHETWDAPSITVNEFKASGDVEWFELVNNGSSDYDLGKFSVTDTGKTSGEPRYSVKMRFPEGTTIPAHGHILVRTGVEGQTPGPHPSGECLEGYDVPCYFATFGISSLGGDSLYLLSPYDDIVVQTPYPAHLEPGVGETACRLPDGSGDFFVCRATPGAKNGGRSLTLAAEKRFDSFPELAASSSTFEASGVAFYNGTFHVAFDNSTAIASLESGIVTGTAGTVSLTQGQWTSSQYEGIAYGNPDGGKAFFVAQETDASLHAAILRFNDTFTSSVAQTTDLQFTDANKGVEGIAWFSDRLFALCEQSGCGDSSQDHGTVKVLKLDAAAWTTEATLAVPQVGHFLDYADIALYDLEDGTATVAIVSQESSALWVGTLAQNPWRFVDAGQLYEFPQDQGRYCSVEGIAFFKADMLVAVSDKTGDAACTAKSESIHLFSLP